MAVLSMGPYDFTRVILNSGDNTVDFVARISPLHGPVTISARVPRYNSSNPSGGVTYDEIVLGGRNRAGAHTASCRVSGERYFDFNAIRALGVHFSVTRDGTSVDWLQEFGKNTWLETR